MLDYFIIKIDSSRVWIDAKTSNYFEHILSFISAVAGSVSISYFAFLVGIPIGIANSVAKIKRCAITTGIKNYHLVIKKKKEKHGKIELLANSYIS